MGLFFLFLLPPDCVVVLIVDITQIRGGTKQALLPPPKYGTRLQFYLEKTPALSFLVGARIEL